MKLNSIKIIVILMFFAAQAYAQLSVGASYGAFNLRDNQENFTYDGAEGFALKANYVYKFSNKLGIGTGVEYAKYKQNISINEQNSYTAFLVDNTNSAFEYQVNTNGYQEKQDLSTLQIPLFLQFKTEISPKAKFFTRAGVKYVLPQSFKIEGTANTVKTSGYYPDVNLLITDLPEYGFGTQSNYTKSSTYETKNFLATSFEVGIGFKFIKKTYLYTSIYLDHALSSVIENSSANSFIGYSPIGLDNKPLNGVYTQNSNTEVKPRTFGVSLTLSFE
jgi:hypothetical protein